MVENRVGYLTFYRKAMTCLKILLSELQRLRSENMIDQLGIASWYNRSRQLFPRLGPKTNSARYGGPY